MSCAALVVIKVEIQRRNGVWDDITQYVNVREDIEIERGRREGSLQVDPSRLTLQLNNRDGRFSPRNPRSVYFRQIGKNTPIRLAVVDRGAENWRFAGEVSAWPVEWEPGDVVGAQGCAEVWVPIQASGILRRLAQGADVQQDAPSRWIPTRSPVAYWPLTDGQSSRQGEPVVGDQPMRTYAPGSGAQPFITTTGRWGEGAVAPWLSSCFQVNDRQERGRLSSSIRPSSPTTSWAVEVVKLGGGSDSLQARMRGSGTNDDPLITWAVVWAMDLQSINITVQYEDQSGSSIATVGPSVPFPQAWESSEMAVWRLEISPSGASNTAYRLYVNGVSVISGTSSGVSPRPLSSVSYSWWNPTSDNSGLSTPANLAHMVVWNMNREDYPTAGESLTVYRGHAGERAGERIERTCAENNIPLQIIGDVGDTHLMGPQYPESVLEILQAAQNVDGGVLYEGRDFAGLVYRTLRSKYNREVLIT